MHCASIEGKQNNRLAVPNWTWESIKKQVANFSAPLQSRDTRRVAMMCGTSNDPCLVPTQISIVFELHGEFTTSKPTSKRVIEGRHNVVPPYTSFLS